MKTYKGCTYWYEIIMYVDKESDGYRSPAIIRIPVRCEESGVHTSKCTYLDPSSASIQTENLPNEKLFDSQIPSAAAFMSQVEARVELDEYAKIRGWDRQKLIGWSEAADFAEWYVTKYLDNVKMRRS